MEGSATRVNFQVEAKCDEANGFLDASKEVQNKQAGIEYPNQDDDEAIVTLSSVYSLYHPTIFNCLYELYVYIVVFFLMVIVFCWMNLLGLFVWLVLLLQFLEP